MVLFDQITALLVINRIS